jgi:hypothetical protein
VFVKLVTVTAVVKLNFVTAHKLNFVKLEDITAVVKLECITSPASLRLNFEDITGVVNLEDITAECITSPASPRLNFEDIEDISTPAEKRPVTSQRHGHTATADSAAPRQCLSETVSTKSSTSTNAFNSEGTGKK